MGVTTLIAGPIRFVVGMALNIYYDNEEEEYTHREREREREREADK